MERPIWEDFGELLKVQVTIVSVLYIVFGFIITAIAAHNQLLFDLASDGRPTHFVPYRPVMNNIMVFTVVNMVWIFLGFIGSFLPHNVLKRVQFVAFCNISLFLCSLGYFTYLIYNIADLFTF